MTLPEEVLEHMKRRAQSWIKRPSGADATPDDAINEELMALDVLSLVAEVCRLQETEADARILADNMAAICVGDRWASPDVRAAIERRRSK